MKVDAPPDDTTSMVSPLELVSLFQQGAPPESHDFDFLLGDWDVRGSRLAPDGSVLLDYLGHWHAETLCDGRMVLDHFTAWVDGGEPFVFFATLRTYWPVDRRWEMTFLTAQQPQLLDRFTGRRVGDEMHLQARGRGVDGRAVEAKVRFHGIAADRFSWEQVTSLDGGDHWMLEARIEATRR